MDNNRYTLYKNSRPIVYGLSKKTYLMTFESMRRKSAEAFTFVGDGHRYFFGLGKDVYRLEPMR